LLLILPVKVDVGGDCDAGLAGDGEFEFHVWIQGKQYVDVGSNLNPLQLGDGDSYSLANIDGAEIGITKGTMEVAMKFEATEWDVGFFADSRMDHGGGTFVVKVVDGKLLGNPGPVSFSYGAASCLVELTMRVLLV
jgi:hypothetical protein